jgi:formylmethanofuran dehydrogenase subunit B
MPEAVIGERAATLAEATREAAALLRRSRFPVIAGLATDIAGAEAAVALADAARGAIDHVHAASVLADLGVMREAGWMIVTPREARARADVVLLVGGGLGGFVEEAGLEQPLTIGVERGRHVVRIGCEPDGAADLPITLASLRALVAGRSIARSMPSLEATAKTLNEAAFGVAVWNAAMLDLLAIEMLCGLIDDLNARTRFAGVPVAARGNGAGVAQAVGWHTGFPMRTGFARGRPEHDPWRFDASRLVESGEADAAVWVGGLDAEIPSWIGKVPTVTLAAAEARFRVAPAIRVNVGCPAIDHDAVLFDTRLGVLAASSARAASKLPRAADVLRGITSALTSSC